MRGGYRRGAGRKPGSKNVKTAELLRSVEETGLTPLDYLLSVMRDERSSPTMRLDAAKAAAPFVHPRRNAITVDAEIRKQPTREELEAQARELGLPLEILFAPRGAILPNPAGT